QARTLADEEALDLRLARLAVFGVDAVVADLRVGHADDLALVRGVGEHLLIARQAGVENHLAERLALGPERPSAVDGAVLQRQLRLLHLLPLRDHGALHDSTVEGAPEASPGFSRPVPRDGWPRPSRTRPCWSR